MIERKSSLFFSNGGGGLGSSGARRKVRPQTEPLPRKANGSQAPEKDARDLGLEDKRLSFGNGAELLGGLFVLFSGGCYGKQT